MEFKSQVCTSRIQSELLLSLGLKKETADMCYKYFGTNSLGRRLRYNEPSVGVPDVNDIPAWSLHRLIEMMPKKVVTPTKGHYYRVLYNNSIGYEIGEYSIAMFFGENIYDKIISCIEWLIKEGYFNKEFLEEM